MKALVVEGGGMRGAYAAGVMSALHESGEVFDASYASSSGACSAAYLAAGQPEGVVIWQDHLHGNRLLRARNLLVGRPYLDLDYLMDELFARRLPLDVARLRACASPIWAVLTDAATGLPEYRDLRVEPEPLRTLRASAALPIAYPRPVELGGRFFVDGSVSDPIPIRRALDDGATDVTVVLTRPLGDQRSELKWIIHLASRSCPGIRDALGSLHERYNDALALVAQPPDGVTVRAIAPPPGLRISRLTRSARALRSAVARGLEDGRTALTSGRALPAGRVLRSPRA